MWLAQYKNNTKFDRWSRVEIKWVDATSAHKRWEERYDEEIPQEEKLMPAPTESVGYIYEDTETYITLIGDKNEWEVGRKLTIPKCCIAELEVL